MISCFMSAIRMCFYRRHRRRSFSIHRTPTGELSNYRAGGRRTRGITIRRAVSEIDADGINAVYAACGMVQLRADFFSSERDNRAVTYFVAQDDATGEIVGTVTGINHQRLFNDPDQGGSLWCLAVHPQARQPGIGEKLVRKLAEHFQARGLNHVDLSVLYDNDNAIRLYEKLKFRRVPLLRSNAKTRSMRSFSPSRSTPLMRSILTPVSLWTKRCVAACMWI